MRYLLSIYFFAVLFSSYGQRKYDFENPWKAKSNEHVLEWFLDNLDPTSDSLLLTLFDDLDVNTDSLQWIYPSDVFYTLHNNGWDYYSRKVYFVDNKDKKVIAHQKNISENKLANSLFNLSYFYKDGVTTLVLIEYY